MAVTENEQHDQMVKRTAKVVNNVTDSEAPVGIDESEIVDVEGVLTGLLVDFTPDAMRARLLKSLNLPPERIKVGLGPLVFPPWAFKGKGFGQGHRFTTYAANRGAAL